MPNANSSSPRNGLDRTYRTEMSRSQLNDIQHQLQSVFNRHPHLQEKRFRFDAEEGRVVMHGTVNTWYEKQMAQEALRNIDGVRQIENELLVELSS